MSRLKEGKEYPSGKYEYTVIRPGGNDTALVFGIVEDPVKRKLINDEIMQQQPNVEQVGFVNIDISGVRLQMAGGEFCGNATRSTAWLALDGKPGELMMQVSGTQQLLRAGVDSSGNAWAQMPIYADPERVKALPNGAWIVELEGITQVIVPVTQEQPDKEELEKTAFSLLSDLGLTESVAAAGVMYLTEGEDGIYKIDPIVFVRAINTLFYETACGSGTTAVGLMLSVMCGSSISVDVLQPSGLLIGVSTRYKDGKFEEARISGGVEAIAKGSNYDF